MAAKDDYEDMRLISEDIVKLELDLKNIKLLKAENKILLKNILLRLLAGEFGPEYYEMSLVDIKLEMIRLRIDSENRKVCYLLDSDNINYVSAIADLRTNIILYEEQLKTISRDLRKEAGNNRNIIVVKSSDIERMRDGNGLTNSHKSHFSKNDEKYFSDIDKKLRDPRLLDSDQNQLILCSDDLTDVQHKLLETKREYDLKRENEIKRMLKRYSKMEGKTDQLDTMVKHFALLFGINRAIKILSSHFIKFKKYLREVYDPELR